MLIELRKLAWNYNCYVFNYGSLKSNLYQIYCLDLDSLTKCIKEINHIYYIEFLSELYKRNDLLGFYYIVEI